MSEKFIPNKLALITLLAACSVILISMGLRQTFGLFFKAFEEGLNCTRTEFGLAIGLQMIFWGIFAPIFGFLKLINLEEINQFLLVLLFLE